MDARSSLRDNNRNAMPPRQAPRARAPALTGIVILLLRLDRTRRALGFLEKTQSHESGFGAGFWSHQCVLCRPKTSRGGEVLEWPISGDRAPPARERRYGNAAWPGSRTG